MKWTKEKPTKPGWYWFRSETEYGTCTTVLEIRNVQGGLVVVETIAIYPLEEFREGEWAGPIPEPEEVEP